MASEQLTKKGMDSRVIDFLKKMNTGVIAYRRKETEIPKEVRAASREMFARSKGL